MGAGAGVGEAVAHVQPRRMAALAKAGVSVERCEGFSRADLDRADAGEGQDGEQPITCLGNVAAGGVRDGQNGLLDGDRRRQGGGARLDAVCEGVGFRFAQEDGHES